MNSFSAPSAYAPHTPAWWIPVATDFVRHGIPPCTRVPIYLLSSSPREPLPMIILPTEIAYHLRVPCIVRIPRSRLRPVHNSALWSMAMDRMSTVYSPKGGN